MTYRLRKLLLFILGLLFLFPIIVTVTNSLMTPTEVLRNDSQVQLIPQKISIRQYYILLFEHLDYLHMFWKSVYLAVTITFINTLYSIFIGCILGKVRLWGSKIIICLYILALIMPYQITMLPNYMIFKSLNILETDAALIISMGLAPLGVILVTLLVKLVPNELIEATRLETSSLFQIFQGAIYPSIKGTFTILIIFIFSEIWNMVEQPLTIYSSIYKQPLSVLLAYIQYDTDIIFAASVVYMFPAIIINFYFHESLEEELSQLK